MDRVASTAEPPRPAHPDNIARGDSRMNSKGNLICLYCGKRIGLMKMV